MLVGLCAMIIATPQTPRSTMSCLLAVGLTNNRQFVHICRIISALSSHNLLIDRICVASHEFPGVRWRNFRLARALFALVEYCLNTNMGPTGEWGAFARGRSVQKGGHMHPRLHVCLAMSPHVLDAISSSTYRPIITHSLYNHSQSVQFSVNCVFVNKGYLFSLVVKNNFTSSQMPSNAQSQKPDQILQKLRKQLRMGP